MVLMGKDKELSGRDRYLRGQVINFQGDAENLAFKQKLVQLRMGLLGQAAPAMKMPAIYLGTGIPQFLESGNSITRNSSHLEIQRA